jgi:hypothetical protein
MRLRRIDCTAAMLTASLLGASGCHDDLGVKDRDGGANAASSGDASSGGGNDNQRGAVGAPCTTTWAAIQKTILAGRGCTQNVCHDSTEATGMLDLSPDVAYEHLVNIESSAEIEMPLITPGEEKLSLLYLKLEAKTKGIALPAAAGAPMPTAGDALSVEQLAALRLWIRAGAPQGGVVDGTQSLLDCALTDDVVPSKIVPPPVPKADEGFQNYSGPWSLKAGSEDEVCYGTYYDLTDDAPEWARVDCDSGEGQRGCIAYYRHQLTQDAQSHHSVVFGYRGPATATDPAWGSWQCGGGELAGMGCDPTKPKVSVRDGGGDCGPKATCQATITDKLACIGYGPADFATARFLFGGAQSPVSTIVFGQDVYSIAPIKGMVIWNSHAFNLTKQDTTVEQYHNFWYARPEIRKFRVKGIFDIRYVFSMNVPPFESREFCASYSLEQHAHVTMLTSHVHKRGVLYRAWLPPNAVGCTPPDCRPNDTPPFYVSRAYNDPTVMELDPPLIFSDPEPENREFKYCAVYDNGEADPSTVRRASGLPEGASACTPTHCVGGPNQAEPCSSDADCADGGKCDACPLIGGFTTEDEMLEFQGTYFVKPPAG